MYVPAFIWRDPGYSGTEWFLRVFGWCVSSQSTVCQSFWDDPLSSLVEPVLSKGYKMCFRLVSNWRPFDPKSNTLPNEALVQDELWRWSNLFVFRMIYIPLKLRCGYQSLSDASQSSSTSFYLNKFHLVKYSWHMYLIYKPNIQWLGRKLGNMDYVNSTTKM